MFTNMTFSTIGGSSSSQPSTVPAGRDVNPKIPRGHTYPSGRSRRSPSRIFARMIGGHGVTKGDIVVLAVFVLLLLLQPLVALALAVLWAIAFIARRGRKN